MRQLGYRPIAEKRQKSGNVFYIALLHHFFHHKRLGNLRRLQHVLPTDLGRIHLLLFGKLLHNGILFPEQLVNADTQYLRQLREFGNIGHGVAALPVGDRLKADTHGIGKLHLRHILLLSAFCNLSSDFNRVKHTNFSLSAIVSRSAPLLYRKKFSKYSKQCLSFAFPGHSSST